MIRRNKTLFCLSFSVLFVLAGAASALACSCAPPGPPKEEMARAKAVFSGEVVEVVTPPSGKAAEGTWRPVYERGDDSRMPAARVRFKVDKSWKLVETAEVVVTTPLSSAACGYSFQKGVSYLVYAYPGAGDTLSTGICSRTRRIADAGEDLRALGAGRAVSSASVKAAATVKPAAAKPKRKPRRVVRRRRHHP